MDERRVVEPFRDELGLAIEATMRVTPGAELGAKVRARIDHERAAVARWSPWQLAFGGALAAAIIVAVTTASWQQTPERGPAVADIAAAQHDTLAAYAVPTSPAPPQIERTVVRVRETESHARTEAARLAAYVAHIRQLRLDPAALTGLTIRPSSEPLKLITLSIERIAIEPLAKLDAIAGEPQ